MTVNHSKVLLIRLGEYEGPLYLAQSYFEPSFYTVDVDPATALEKFRRKIFKNEPEGFHSILTASESFTNFRFRNKKVIQVPRESLTEDLQKSLLDFQSRFAELQVEALQTMSAKPKLLLHVCCGPDAAGVIGQLQEDYELIGFWYDPNIQPKEEYDLRRDAFEKVAHLKSISWIEGEYDVDRFYKHIEGLETTPETGAKCSLCYDLRLERAAKAASDESCEYFATTLAISPHKVQQKLLRFGELSGKRFNVQYVHRNFMKDDGFKDSVKFTEANDIYRQDYCGCYFSLFEGGSKARALAEKLNLTKDDMTKPDWKNPFWNREGKNENEKNSATH
jgi:predicted adenine nucleotide alpha hydrolase (AANH) superfamily ATPase